MTRGEPVERAASLPLERILVLLDAQSVQGDIGGLLLPDVLGDRCLVQPHGGHVVALRPELPVPELVLDVRVAVEHHERALPLQVAHEARHRDLGRDRHEHVHVVGHQVPLYDLDALPLAELPEDLPQVLRYWLQIAFLLYFGVNTMWYLQSHFVCERLLALCAMTITFPSGPAT